MKDIELLVSVLEKINANLERVADYLEKNDLDVPGFCMVKNIPYLNKYFISHKSRNGQVGSYLSKMCTEKDANEKGYKRITRIDPQKGKSVNFYSLQTVEDFEVRLQEDTLILEKYRK